MKTLNSIFIIKGHGIAFRLLSYYYEAEQESNNELFKTNEKQKAVGQELNINAFPIIKKNQINKYLREGKSFFIPATFQAWDKEQKERNTDPDDLDLYLSEDDIKTMKEYETVSENKKGCKEFVKKYYFELTKNIFLASAYDLKLYKSDAEIPPQWLSHTHKLEEYLKENYSFWKEKGKEETIKAYEERIKEGFIYSSFQVTDRRPSSAFVACCGVQRVEKSKEYQHAEKIKDLLNSCVYTSNKLSIYEVLRILEKCNISKKRK